MQALFVEAEVDEVPGVASEGSGGRVCEMRIGEYAVLNGANAVDAPLIVRDGLGELALDGRLRAEAVDGAL